MVIQKVVKLHYIALKFKILMKMLMFDPHMNHTMYALGLLGSFLFIGVIIFIYNILRLQYY